MWPADKVLFTACAVVALADLGGVRLRRSWHASLSPAPAQPITHACLPGFLLRDWPAARPALGLRYHLARALLQPASNTGTVREASKGKICFPLHLVRPRLPPPYQSLFISMSNPKC